MCWIAGPLPIGTVLLRRSGDKRDDLLPTRYALANVPYVIRRRCPLAWDGLGMVSGGVVFPELSKLLNQEDALGVPCLNTVIVALRRRALAGRRNAADRRHPSLRCHTLRLATPDIRLASADAFAVVAADARVERMGARPNRAVVVKTALTCDSYSHSSTVLEPRRERMKNSLVTAVERLLVKRI
jgi:hypothetical protein